MDQLNFRVLVALRDGPADGNEISDRLRDDNDATLPSLPTLYRSLRAAIAEQWIEQGQGSTAGGPGRPARLYRLTDAGEEALQQEARRHQQLAELVLGDLKPGRGGTR